ncbi:MAG: prepilin peptidase [Gemmatimonadales bacterium]|nr:prepilin peptidase [Gemmatimonadales bacterium]
MDPDPQLPAWFVVALAALFGAVVGSFLNVCILRWGAEPKASVVSPPSRCPRCERALAWFENIPVLSWILLRGRCRGCGLAISAQYPLIELATALLWAFIAWRYGLSLAALQGVAFVTILLGIAMTDARAFIIPHEFTYGGLGIGLLLSLAQGPAGVIAALHGAIFGAGFLYLVGSVGTLLAGREAMGGGDVAMMAMVGAFLGWQGVLGTVFLGSVVGVALYIVGMLFRDRTSAPTATAAVAPVPEPVIAPLDGDEIAPIAIGADAARVDAEPTPEELRAAGYLPFGVSLAIAAAGLLLFVRPGGLAAWFADYALMLGL